MSCRGGRCICLANLLGRGTDVPVSRPLGDSLSGIMLVGKLFRDTCVRSGMDRGRSK
jgi:hypothetical protein